jgi:hypothetical protein
MMLMALGCRLPSIGVVGRKPIVENRKQTNTR